MLLIVGQSVTEAANDKQQLEPMVEAIEQQSGQRPEAILADSGYCSEENLAYLESAEQPDRKIEGFIATGKQKHGEHRLPDPTAATYLFIPDSLSRRFGICAKDREENRSDRRTPASGFHDREAGGFGKKRPTRSM
jgi:Transposase DDE domain